MSTPKIEFLEVHTPHGKSGGILAGSLYEFSVNSKVITVAVPHLAVRTRSGQMDTEEVKRVAVEFLRMQAEKLGWDKLPSQVKLTDAAMDIAIDRLGLNPRFGRRSTA